MLYSMIPLISPLLVIGPLFVIIVNPPNISPLLHFVMCFKAFFLSRLLVAPFINHFSYTPTPLMKLPKFMACKRDYKV